MVLSLRRTRLEKQPVFADLQDWQVLEDGNEIGAFMSSTRQRARTRRGSGRSRSRSICGRRL